MRKLGLVAAVAMLLSILVASIVAVGLIPERIEAAANTNGAPAADRVTASEQRPKITDESIFSQFGFCDDNADASPAAY